MIILFIANYSSKYERRIGVMNDEVARMKKKPSVNIIGVIVK